MNLQAIEEFKKDLLREITKLILTTLNRQDFADWYNEGGRFDAFLQGGLLLFLDFYDLMNDEAYKDWCQNSKQYLTDAENWNKWMDKKKDFLLTNIGPRIAKLGKTGYMGCGFHYDMEGSFGKLIISMMYPWQPCANHCEKVKDQYTSNIITEVLYESLIERIEEAEGNKK